MNKQQKQIRKITKNAITIFVIVVLAGVLYFVSHSFNTDATAKRKEAEDAYNADNAKKLAYQAQIEKSGSAERRFIELQRTHLNPDFSANVDALSSLFSKLKTRYRLPELKVLNSAEKATDKSELQNLDYAVSVRQGMSISMAAMSDMHVFSFINAMLHEGNGLFNITKFKLTTIPLGLDADAITKMQAGERVNVVQGTIDFDWVGITPKDAPKEVKKPGEVQP